MLAAVISKEAFEKLSDDLKKEYKAGEKHQDGLFDFTGKYMLDVSAVDGMSLDHVTGLKSALGSERQTVTDLNAKLKSFEGIDPTKARDAITKVGEMAKWTPEQKVKEQIEATTTQLTEKYDKQIEGKDVEITTLNSQLEKTLIEAEAIRAIAENKGSTELLLPHVKAQTRMVKTDKGDYVVRVMDGENHRITAKTGSTEPMSISELVAEMKTKDTFACAFEGSGASGSGARPGGGGSGTKVNPFAKETFNLTEQSRLTKVNPELAKRLSEEAA